MSRFSLFRLVPASLLLATALHAQSPESVAIRTVLSATKQVSHVEKDGRTTTRSLPAEKVLPGEEVTYQIDVLNTGDKPASDIVITVPVPEHMLYKPEGARGATTPAAHVSVDGGATFGPLETRTVATPEGAARPATAADVTHVRWTLAETIPARGSTAVRYAALLK